MLGAVLVAVLVVILTAYVILLATKKQTKLKTLPGPASWPLLGHTLQMSTNSAGRFDRPFVAWAKQYGKMFRLNVFNQDWVVLSEYEDVHEMLVVKGRIFTDRLTTYRSTEISFGSRNIAFGFPSNPQWLPMKKAAYRALHQHGTGLNRIEEVLVPLAQEFISDVKQYNGREVDIYEALYNFVSKVGLVMLIARKPENDDPLVGKLKTFEMQLRDALNVFDGSELDLFPWLRHFGHPAYKRIQQLAATRDYLWDKLWTESQQTYSPTTESSCIMHSIAQLLDKQSPYYEPLIDIRHAKGLFLDMVGGSVATTSTTAYALLNLLVHYPQVYKRVQQEVDSVLGDRLPSVFDRDSMPYTNATIHELMRYSTITPMNVRINCEDTTIGGQDIPAGTPVVALTSILHRDEAFWGDPDVFRPERFLDDAGKLLPADHPRRKRLMPFGAGSRVCVGEIFALRRLFIFLVSVAQAFDLGPGDKLVTCKWDDYDNGLLLRQKPFTLRLTARQ